MSDCFDHFMDAMEDNMPGGRTYEEGYETDQWRSKSIFTADPLYYHKYIDCHIIEEVGAAYLINFDGHEFHIPQSICDEIKDNSMYVHRKIFNEILKKKGITR